MKRVLTLAFLFILATGFISVLSAQENGNVVLPGTLSFSGNSDLNFGLTPYASGDQWEFREYSQGWRIGASFMNILFGLGSFIMGDMDGAFTILLHQGLGIGFSGGGVLLAWASLGWLQSMAPWEFFLVIGPTLAVGGITLGVGMVVVGVSYYLYGLVYGFHRPFVFQKPTARLDDPRNWDIGLAANKDGNLYGQIAFTAHF